VASKLILGRGERGDPKNAWLPVMDMAYNLRTVG